MTDWPAPTRADHEAFCRREGWQQVYRGRLYEPLDGAGAERVTYVLALPGGRILHTRIGQPADLTSYGPLHAAHVLHDQLGVTADEFWPCVLDGVLPDRQAGPELRGGLSEQMVRLLNATPADRSLLEVESTARQAAIAHLRQHWAANRVVPNGAGPCR
ncbi:MAG TPA: hypothetical protein VMD59_06590 [Acidimicrobiales bacterium]|nr:hypothetical protein [Acidimicrobiales bacterium]